MVTAAAAILVPVAAFAHTMLKRSDPASGAHLRAVPRAIRLMFTEVPDLTFTRVELRDATGNAVALDAPAYAPDSKRAVLAAVRGALDAGTYTVVWQTAGDDGHPTRGHFSFTITPGATGAGVAPTAPARAPGSAPQRGEAAAGATAPGQSAVPAAHHPAAQMPESAGFDAESPLYVAIRWLEFTGLLVVFGTITFRLFVLGFMGREREPRVALIAAAAITAARAGVVATIVVGVAALLRLGAQSVAMHGTADAWDLAFIGAMLRKTVWGWGWLLQAAGGLIALAGFRGARNAPHGAPNGRAEWSWGWTIATLGAAILAFTPALSGHAVSAPRLTALAILADGMHVIGAGGWLGSLLLVVTVGIPAALRLGEGERGSAVADLVNAFSPTALVFAGLTATTGVFAAWLHLGAVNALWQTTYGQTLLVKLAVLSVVAATGAYNWLRVRPTLGDVEGARRVRRSAMVELAVGVLVLAVTAVLVATPTAVDLSAMTP